MSSGVTCDAAAVSLFEDFKLNKKIDGERLRACTFRIEDKKTIVVDQKLQKGSEDDAAAWAAFKGALPENEPRYAVFDLHYETNDGRPQDKIVFIFWSPDNSGVKPKMLYASSKEAIRSAFNGIAKEYQANDMDDLDRAEVVKKCLQV